MVLGLLWGTPLKTGSEIVDKHIFQNFQNFADLYINFKSTHIMHTNSD